MLSFVSAPNFEAPTDNGGNNVYDVIVRVSDGSLSDTQAIAVTVNNVNEVTAVNDIIRTNFDGAAFDVPEWALLFNDTTESGTLDITGIPSDSGLTVTNPAGNVVNINDGNNADGGSFSYTASNGAATSTGNVQVFNINGGGNITGTSANEILVGDGDGDTFDGGGGADIILAGGGNDTIVADQNDHIIDGGSGSDTLRVGANFTSTSNAQIVNIENVTLTAAATLISRTKPRRSRSPVRLVQIRSRAAREPIPSRVARVATG